ncbi:uncharacterized protein [Eurosta solidaginis]|uniref:uncharacterized protein n=1 Tax=Eurosta solidaginis TaxID=178769 RepID=UPI003531211B
MTVWEYRRQTLAVIPDAFIFLAMGMNLAYGMGYNYYEYLVPLHFRFSWFIGVIVGSLCSAVLMKYILKRHFVLLSCALVIMAGIFNIVWPYELNLVIAARYLNGIGSGLIIVPFIVHCSETIVTKKRGYALGLEQFCIAVGIFLQATYIDLWNGAIGISATCAHGIFCLCFGLIALGCAILVIESPIFYIRQDNTSAALDVLTRLKLPSVLSDEKKELLEEHKNYVFKNEFLGLSGSLVHGLGPLLRLVLYRLVLAFTFSILYNIELRTASRYGVTTGFQWPITIALLFRILGVFGGMTMSDPIGRKIIGLVGLLVMSGIGIGITVLFDTNIVYTATYDLSVACTLLVLMQFFAGLYAPTSTIYLSEAFPMLVKPYFIAICVCLENAVQIISIFIFRYNTQALTSFNIFNCAYIFCCFVLFLITIPETKLTTLTEAQDRFRVWMHLRSW